MMGRHDSQKELFSYQVDLDRRVRADHPLRAVRREVDFSFVRTEVAHCYGYNGNESVDPVVILKLMFLLFFDDVKSERELLRTVPERLDYLWFLGYGLDDALPDHSVLSKARSRWGRDVFERLFVRTVGQCVQAGLVDGQKLHMDGSLIEANASRGSVVRSSPELIAQLKRAYGVEERKMEGHTSAPYYEPINASLCSTTDPDTACVRQNKNGPQGETRPRYKHHRAVDDQCGVITAVVTTPGDVAEPSQALRLVKQHAQNVGCSPTTVVADCQYGSVETYRTLQENGLETHIAPLPGRVKERGIFPRSHFAYDQQQDVYTCPAGQLLYPRRFDQRRQASEYVTRAGVCRRCPLAAQCTRGKQGRTLMRHHRQELIDRAIAQGLSSEAFASRNRRRHLMEGSFADAANQHHFKRARWRRIWRQQIQDWLIAACQNIRLFLRRGDRGRPAGAGVVPPPGGRALALFIFYLLPQPLD